MCIDYTNLNQACPKDYYPMPNIDKLIEAVSRNERLSFLDAYFSYHQVPMAPKDEEETSFYAGDEIYCYVMMPFGLKNASATYQKMVTIVFRAQIGQNLEVYVDDIVVKSLKAEDHLTDLEETFNNLRKNRMRLNPAKCIFGVEFGKFLSFMVSRRGIEVNPEKIKAMAEMEPPKLVKDANDGEILYLYLGISDEAISSVLVREEGKQQKPVYYASSVLHGAQIRYSIAEKATLAVVTSARKLRPYFQSHPIIRSAIRAEALADFIVECTSTHSDSQLELDSWILCVDGASSNKGSGAALVAELKCKFQKFHLSKISRAENEQVDSLSKFASDGNQSSRSVFVEILDEPSFLKPKMMKISTNPSTSSWTTPIISFLQDGTVPADKQEEMRLRKKASWYTLVNEVLYKRSFSLPLLYYLNPYEAKYALREVHEGVCGSHIGARTLAHKVLRQGYYWPNMYKDATQFWGLHLLSPFMKGVGGVTHLIVGVDYFTKWVEAWPLSSLTSKKVEDFVFNSITCRYGIPNQIVADNGTQFNYSSFKDFCSSYGIKLQFTSMYHPESNGMAYRTTSRTAIGETPYHLAFATKAVIPIEIGVPNFRVTYFDEEQNGQLLQENLDLLDEVREEARLRTLVYKQKLVNFYNKRVQPQTFKVGDFVFRKAGLTGFETRFGKLTPNWGGSYTVAEVPHPGAYILLDTEGKRVPRIWNVNNLKKFYL
ncbi:hypothetical protein SLEP1_g51842 [Rubroshorea leprosula]|uniref:Integrase catalytic domain-containing protein n=1 Tax=Rubroshorea leprosula TaxID=152421 RepID=A0AAV5M4K1_9ROSI|nr:hypothetical protein SLEP1_g51842 [Rubroshorea leprosula]